MDSQWASLFTAQVSCIGSCLAHGLGLLLWLRGRNALQTRQTPKLHGHSDLPNAQTARPLLGCKVTTMGADCERLENKWHPVSPPVECSPERHHSQRHTVLALIRSGLEHGGDVKHYQCRHGKLCHCEHNDNKSCTTQCFDRSHSKSRISFLFPCPLAIKSAGCCVRRQGT